MERLISFQFRNLFKQKSFYICMIVAVGLASLMTISNNLLSNLISIEIGKMDSNSILLSFINPGQFDIFLTIYVALFFTLDISNGTMKNIIARGFSRKQVFISKYMTTIVGATIMFAVSFIFSYLTCIIVGSNFVALDSNTLSKVAVYYVTIIGLTSLYSLISTITSKSSGALVACLLTSFLAPGILTLVGVLLKLKKGLTISKFWITNAFNNETMFAIIIGIVYIVLSFIVGVIISNHKEIK